ncbi:hypothetical protein MLD38_036164 [Melastoma candidum]|uniref:Uncharacterized protein n=1 Tax=Melastoma candidum TaxID=119954 RepID=A0ACB9LJ16_9MYRT|nr:hypothetical protein MLD38_036164 [Melastoma candidum]
MEVLEDDLFFADLSKQISLLIMDEEDDHVSLALAPPWSSYPLQDMSYVIPSTQQGGQGILGHGQPQPRHVQEKNQQLAMSKGTGVFIPKFAQPRKKRTTLNHNHHHHQNPSRHSHPINYSRPATNYNHYRHHQHQQHQQQQQQHDFYYSARRFSQEEDESKASYYINPNKF